MGINIDRHLIRCHYYIAIAFNFVMVNLMLNHFMRPNFIKNKILIIITMFITFSCAQTKENDHKTSAEIVVLPEYIFSPVTNLSEQVEQTLTSAKTQNKKALLVLGAQWCHDSKGLAKNFSTPQMQKILIDNYQVLFIDVGYLETGFDVVKQFNMPIYYGTPTVMVVDPNSAKILNKSSMQKWLNADKVPLTDYVEYFGAFSSKNSTSNNKEFVDTNQAMNIYLNKINKFEQKQAVRLKKAYGVIGPLLKQYMESDNKDASDEFSDKWEQVHDFRSHIQDDIQALVAQAKTNVDTGSSALLDLPTYPTFTWE